MLDREKSYLSTEDVPKGTHFRHQKRIVLAKAAGHRPLIEHAGYNDGIKPQAAMSHVQDWDPEP